MYNPKKTTCVTFIILQISEKRFDLTLINMVFFKPENRAKLHDESSFNFPLKPPIWRVFKTDKHK